MDENEVTGMARDGPCSNATDERVLSLYSVISYHHNTGFEDSICNSCVVSFFCAFIVKYPRIVGHLRCMNTVVLCLSALMY